MLAGNLNSRAVKYMQARLSRYKHSSSTQGISRKLVLRLPFKNPMFSRKVQVTLPLSFCHVLKHPKDIESDMLSGGLVYLFRALETYIYKCTSELLRSKSRLLGSMGELLRSIAMNVMCSSF